MRHWLVKSEPTAYSIDDLAAADGQTTFWDGVRNYQARNFLRDDFKRGDTVFYYHSNCALPGIAGIAKVTSVARPDPTAFDPKDGHYDEKSDPDDPRWFGVDLKLVRKFDAIISLAELKQHATDALDGFVLLRRGNRLSVMPVDDPHWDFILQLEQ